MVSDARSSEKAESGTPRPICARRSGSWECRAPKGHADGAHVWASLEREAEIAALVDRVTDVIVRHQRIPIYGHIPNAQRCSGGCPDLRSESDGPNSPRHARHVAEQIVAELKGARRAE